MRVLRAFGLDIQGEAGDEDDEKLRVVLTNGLSQGAAVYFGEGHVGYERVDLVGPAPGERIGAIRERNYLEAAGLEDVDQQAPEVVLVVNQ